MLYAVVMAGGSGTRFWPASRAEQPKQLLRLVGDRSMLQSTVDRLGDLVPAERVLVVTNRRLVEPIRDQLPEVPATQIMGEPCKRDTAPCVGLAAALIVRQDPEAVMVVMPSDHVIRTPDQFQDAVRLAVRLVEQRPERLVTFGIRPTYPAEVFGYIERAAHLPGWPNEADCFAVKQFREKPKAEIARDYLRAGTFYWNAGIFVWRAATIIAQLRAHEPEMLARLETIADAYGQPGFAETFQTEFTAIQGKSIDYAVMEKAPEVAVIEAPFQWDDLGGWEALARLRGADGQGNTVDGETALVETKNSIIRTTPGHLIATLGVEGLIIVHTANATLVARREDEEQIRQIVKQLEETGQRNYL